MKIGFWRGTQIILTSNWKLETTYQIPSIINLLFKGIRWESKIMEVINQSYFFENFICFLALRSSNFAQMILDWFICFLKEFYSTQWDNRKALNSPNLNRQDNSSYTYLMIVFVIIILHTCQFEFTPNIGMIELNSLIPCFNQSWISKLTMRAINHSLFPSFRNSVSLSHCWNVILIVSNLSHRNILSSHHLKCKESSDHWLPLKTSC
jgi:hypothetical protein